MKRPLEKGLVQTPDALPSVEAKLHTNGEVQHAGELSAFLQCSDDCHLDKGLDGQGLVFGLNL